MGGEREDYIESGKTVPVKDVPAIETYVIQGNAPENDDVEEELIPDIKQKLRFHENAGQVHFHDDALGLKAAVPVAEWFSAMKQTRNFQKWQFLDISNSTLISAKPYVKDDVADIYVSLKKVDIGHTLKALEKFTLRK